MKMLLKFIKWLGILSLSGILIIAVALRFLNFSASEEEIREAFSSTGFSPDFKISTTANREIFYVTVGDTSNQPVLFVHGSPGSWDNFLTLMSNPDLLDDFYFISVDRPGFGKSGHGNPERSLAIQASLIAQILLKEKKPAILVGHSYGGPVVVRMGIDFPKLTDGIVIIAGSVDPELEKTKWYQVPVHYKALSWILPGFLYSTNEEILALKKELELMEPDWGFITQPVSVIQGGNDQLVPEGNADYAENMLTGVSKLSMVQVQEMNHFVPWTNPELIIQELYTIKEFNLDTSLTE